MLTFTKPAETGVKNRFWSLYSYCGNTSACDHTYCKDSRVLINVSTEQLRAALNLQRHNLTNRFPVANNQVLKFISFDV